jgi:hypothetical protein
METHLLKGLSEHKTKTKMTLPKKKKSRLSAVSQTALCRFNARYAGVTSKAQRTHFSVVASAMEVSATYTLHVSSTGSNKKCRLRKNKVVRHTLGKTLNAKSAKRPTPTYSDLLTESIGLLMCRSLRLALSCGLSR